MQSSETNRQSTYGSGMPAVCIGLQEGAVWCRRDTGEEVLDGQGRYNRQCGTGFGFAAIVPMPSSLLPLCRCRAVCTAGDAHLMEAH